MYHCWHSLQHILADLFLFLLRSYSLIVEQSIDQSRIPKNCHMKIANLHTWSEDKDSKYEDVRIYWDHPGRYLCKQLG